MPIIAKHRLQPKLDIQLTPMFRAMESTEGNIVLHISREYRRAMYSAVMEPCFGYRVNDFEATVGCSETEARRIVSLLKSLPDLPEVTFTIARRDLPIIRNAHRETLRELGIQEYHTRTGVDFSDGEALLAELDKFLGEKRPTRFAE